MNKIISVMVPKIVIKAINALILRIFFSLNFFIKKQEAAQIIDKVSKLKRDIGKFKKLNWLTKFLIGNHNSRMTIDIGIRSTNCLRQIQTIVYITQTTTNTSNMLLARSEYGISPGFEKKTSKQ